MIRKHIIGLSLVFALIATGCAYDPVSKDNTGRYIPEPTPVISEPLNLRVTNFERRAPIPQKCKELGLLSPGPYWRSDNTVLGLHGASSGNRILSNVSVIPSLCYDIISIDNNAFIYPGVTVKYISDTTLEVTVNISNENLSEYVYVSEEKFGSIVSIENVSSGNSPVFHVHLKKRALYAVEYNDVGMYRTELRLYLAHA